MTGQRPGLDEACDAVAPVDASLVREVYPIIAAAVLATARTVR